MAPEYADGFYQRAVVHMAMQQFDDAESDFRRALDLAPDHAASLNDYAVLLMHRKRNEEARELLERVLELNPNDKLVAGNLRQLDG